MLPSKFHIPIVTFVHAIAEEKNTFLLVEETNGAWYFPAGKVEIHETILEGLHREVEEESGLSVEPSGLLEVRHQLFDPQGGNMSARFDFLFAVAPASGQIKTQEDEHSMRADWYLPSEIPNLPLRSHHAVLEILDLYRTLKASSRILPIEHFRTERIA